MNNFDKNLKLWLEDINQRKNKVSDLTKKSYIFYLNKFNEWLMTKNIDEITFIKKEHIEAYRDYMLNDRGNSPGTFNQTRAALFSFFDVMEDLDVVRKNPVKKVQTLQFEKKYQGNLSKGEALGLIQFTKEKDTSCHAVRNHAIIQIALKTGLRVSNIQSLTVDMAKKDMWEIVGKRKSKVFISIDGIPGLREAIDAYLAIRPDYDFDNLFGNQLNRPLAIPGIRHIVESRTDKIGNKTTPHGLRRTYGDRAFNASGGNKELVSDALGHQSKEHKTADQHYINPKSKAGFVHDVVAAMYE